MRLRKPMCTCAYCTFYQKMLESEDQTLHYTRFEEDVSLTIEGAFLIMDERASINLEYVPVTYFN